MKVRPFLLSMRSGVYVFFADRRLFFVAGLTEMAEKEKQLATDPDCSTILERMIHSMDDFVRRVFMDKLSGSSVAFPQAVVVCLTDTRLSGLSS